MADLTRRDPDQPAQWQVDLMRLRLREIEAQPMGKRRSSCRPSKACSGKAWRCVQGGAG
jgi:hypothetical protein